MKLYLNYTFPIDLFKLQNGVRPAKIKSGGEEWRSTQKPQCSRGLIQLQLNTCPSMCFPEQSWSWEWSFLLLLYSENEQRWGTLADETRHKYFKKEIYFVLFMCTCSCLPMVRIHEWRHQKSPEEDIGVTCVVSYPSWVLGPKLWSTGGAARSPNHWATSSALHLYIELNFYRIIIQPSFQLHHMVRPVTFILPCLSFLNIPVYKISKPKVWLEDALGR